VFDTVSPAAYTWDDGGLVLENRTVFNVLKLLLPSRPGRSISRSSIATLHMYQFEIPFNLVGSGPALSPQYCYQHWFLSARAKGITVAGGRLSQNASDNSTLAFEPSKELRRWWLDDHIFDMARCTCAKMGT